MRDNEHECLTLNEAIYFGAVARTVRRVCGKLPPAFCRPEVDPDAPCIAEAERLSTGGVPLEGEPCPLRSILGEVDGQGIKRIVGDDHFPLKENETRDVGSRIGKLRAALEALSTDASACVTADNALNVFFNNATTMACCQSLDDVSLYDQASVMAALAVCLAAEDIDGERPLLLIGGDLSGIQNYIYQIVSKHAAKSLKGRSFYIRLLADAVVRVLLDRLGLCRANVIYCSGGSFYVLAPNNAATLSALDDARRFIERRIYEAHDTSIYMAIDSVALSKAEVEGDGLQQRWKELFDRRDRRKQQRYADLIAAGDFFTPQPMTSDVRDAITGLDLKESDVATVKGKSGEKLTVSHINKAQIDLGKKLKECAACVVSTAKGDIEPAGLGFHYQVLDNAGLKAFSCGNDEVLIVYNNSVKQYGTWSVRTEYLGGNTMSETFEEMCDNEDGKFKRLGVLRMDVDNLGSIFQKGIEPVETSMARYAALSRSFDWFFSLHINEMRAAIDPSGDSSFVLYSGGDDLFVVGAWQVVIDLASEINRRFKEYACGNPKFTISGGVSLTVAKFPIITGAQLAGEEESRAKSHKCGDHEKNSISLLGRALNWDREFPAVYDLALKIHELLKEDLVKSFVTKIMTHAANAEIVNHRITVVKTYWMMAYDMKRMSDRLKGDAKVMVLQCDKEVRTPGGTLNGVVVTSDYHPLELWQLAARWAELMYRS